MTGSRQRTIGATIVASVALLVALSPTLLLGQPPSAPGLVLTGAAIAGIGLLLRRAGGDSTRTPGTILASIGGLLLIAGLGLTVLVLLGWGRPF